MTRKPYRYQYNGTTLKMEGWCGLNDQEQEWLRQLEHYVHAMTDKMVTRLLQVHTTDDCQWVVRNYRASIKDAQGQISRLKSRVNAKYGKY